MVKDMLCPYEHSKVGVLLDMNANALPQLLKEYRTTYNVTQEQLSVDLSVEVRTIRRWELGETILRD